ncbi:hypothetical protein AN219_05870 [Streptomyces nanshensis]|nr:hypothetical protein AN219_05870 [Streptomyces nanshensis]
MHAGSVLRALRAGSFAAVCVLLASVGHTLMSGASVPGWMLLLAWLGAALLGWSLADRERGPLLVGALTVGTQALLHCVFSLGQAMAGHGVPKHGPLADRWTTALLGHSGRSGRPEPGLPAGHGSSHSMHGGGGMEHHAPSAGMDGMAADAHHAQHTGAALPDPGSMDGMAHGGMAHGGIPGGTTGMLAAHLLVALLSAWWLWGGERAVFRAVRAASVRLFAPLVSVVDVVLPAPAPAVFAGWRERSRTPRKLFLSHVIWLRGPPRGRAV